MKNPKTFISSYLAALSILISLLCAGSSFAAGPADKAEDREHCKECGMDLAPFGQSRMLIVYSDGTAAEVCSLHCAARNMEQNRDKQIKFIMVADYTTKEMIDARSAAWVVGGSKDGGMNAQPKWAFAKEDEARKFIRQNGGSVVSYDKALKAAEEEVGQGADTTSDHNAHMGCGMGNMDMEPGSQMLFNPAFADHIYHTHPAGMWMVNYEFMHMDMSGLRAGTTDVGLQSVGYKRHKPYDYMMIPTSMTMDMHMVMVMYGITDRLTVMVMANYQANKMNMLMDMGPMSMKPIAPEAPMTTSGFGDTELRGMYKIDKYLVGSIGLSLPTGSIKEQIDAMGKIFRAPYDMQLGSGTYDLKPALTYNGLSDDAKWNWGAQAQYTWHPAKNEDNWSFGDNFKVTSWLQRAFGPAASWVRLAYNDTGRIRGEDSEIDKFNHPAIGIGAPMPDAGPGNYGGQRLDGLVGVSYTKGQVSLGIEGGIPLYQDLNGLQLKTTWVLNAGMQVMF